MKVWKLVLGMVLPSTVGLIVSGAMSSAHAASFDCKSARSPLEKDICADASLSQADEAMASVYRAQHAAAPIEFRDRLRDSQRSWLAYIGPFCSVPAGRRVQCLRDGFEDRTEELKQATRQAGPLTFVRATTYAVGFSPDRTDRAFTHQSIFLQIAAPQTEAIRHWNRMALDKLKDTASTDEPVDDVEPVANLSGASADLISVRFGTSYYGASMAHPQYYSSAVVWSLRLDRPLTFADLFKDVGAGKDRLAKQALAHFEGDGREDGVTQAAIRETLDNEHVWEVTPIGLLLDYDPYAFGCYPCTGRALVPWAELAPYLRADLPFVVKDLRD